MTIQTTIDQAKLEAFIGKVLGDFGATAGAAMVVIGDKLGLYRAMSGAGPLTAAELARRTGCSERYLRDWLVNQAAGGYMDFDAVAGTYTLPPEQALALADETSPAFVVGGFQVMTAITKATDRIAEAVRSGGGMAWGEHHPDLFVGTERFFRPGYLGNLVQHWIPALDGVQQKLEAGAHVADVGCGHGASTIILAQAYPHSRFSGFDNHSGSIEAAGRAAAEAGVDDRVTFDVAQGTDFPGGDYDLIAFFDCLHDIGKPSATAKHVYETLAPDGTVLIVEPMAGDRTEDNLNPIGRIFGGASVALCTANALAAGGPALGPLARDAEIRQTMICGGFTRFRRATQTPFNRVFEARK